MAARRAMVATAGADLPAALSPQVVFLHQPDGQAVALALGLQWRIILGRDLVRQARQRARQEGASHWVHAGGRAEAVGLVLERDADAAPAGGWPRVWYAAAQVFARLAGEGTHAAMLPLPHDAGVCWLALVRDGQVVAGGDLCLKAQDVGVVWESWRQRHGADWQVWRKAPGSGASDVVALDWDALLSAVSAESLLQARNRGGRLRHWYFAATTGLLFAAAWLGWQTWKPVPRMSTPVVEEAHVASHEAVADVWEQALEEWRRATLLPTVQGLEQLAQSLLLAPLRVVGWKLEHIACRPQAPALWHCTGQYRREHPLARQRSLFLALPSDWQLQWQGLEQVRVEWPVSVESKALQWEALKTGAERWLPDADAWLAVQPLWRSIEWGRRQAVAVSIPVSTQSAEGLPRPANLPEIGQRQLVVSGPLRSLALLAPQFAERTRWEVLELRVGQETDTGHLHDSALELTLQGVVYESSPS